MNLKLAFVEGPREGESVEYKPGSTIRIGRLVRGNEIAIKDVGISTKHIRIVSESEKWIIYDLGSRNGTILNSETLDRDTPVNLRHGDVIKLGGDTSIVVNFEADAQAQEHKLPPRPRRNNRRLPVADPDPDPVESVQEKPTRKRRSAKEDEHEPPKRSKKLEDIAKEVKSRVTRSRKKMEEEVPVEKKGNSRSRGGNKNTENLGLEENVEEKRPLRVTRSKKRELGGDCFLELEMVLDQTRKSRAKKKKMESDKDVEEEDETSEQVEIETLGEEDLNSGVREDGETENLQGDCKSQVAGVETSDGGCDEEKQQQESGSKKKNVDKVDFEKWTLGDWFIFMEVYLPKKIQEETEKMIDPMRSKALRVHKYIFKSTSKQREKRVLQSSSPAQIQDLGSSQGANIISLTQTSQISD